MLARLVFLALLAVVIVPAAVETVGAPDVPVASASAPAPVHASVVGGHTTYVVLETP